MVLVSKYYQIKRPSCRPLSICDKVKKQVLRRSISAQRDPMEEWMEKVTFGGRFAPKILVNYLHPPVKNRLGVFGFNV